MKSISRQYVWWPCIDKDLETCVSTCTKCQVNRNKPAETTLSMWEYPKEPWSRVHIDFMGPYMGKSFSLIIVDSYTKWIDAVIMNSITAECTIEVLRRVFATHGIPKVLYTSSE
ncbi:uncharacterized protein K02A2.6-like [Anneissia japonica]|uniref:uncharacterized protein K02A2.6-like n=1 Tax=Anneissia japonica TaxID=1529436 RepID=UPI0014259E1D|nr:uncharacterized protein K02A2.6-like [Anneissia japonica]